MNVTCTITADTLAGMSAGLDAGTYDAIIDNVAISQSREQYLAFSIPYAALCHTFATLKGSEAARRLAPSDEVIRLDDNAAIDQAMDRVRAALKGKTVGHQGGGIAPMLANTYIKGTMLTWQYRPSNSWDLDLAAGRVAAFLGSKYTLLGIMSKPSNQDIVLAGPCFQVGRGAGVGLRKQDPDLKAMFDQVIRDAQTDGTIRRLAEPFFHMDVTPR